MMYYFTSILFAISVVFVHAQSQENGSPRIITALPNETPQISKHLLYLAKKLKQSDRPVQEDQACYVCEEAVGGIIALRKSGASRDDMASYLRELCTKFTDWGATPCKSRVEITVDTINYIIDERKDLRPARFCSIYFQQYGCQDPNADTWSIPLPPKPTNIAHDRRHYSAQIATETVKVLQITDVHLDSLYTPGSNAKCSEPLCCQTGRPAKPEDGAGIWGDYNVCDMPWHGMQNMLRTIKNKHKDIDWIYFTGDIVSHMSWATSVPANSATISMFFLLLEGVFPGKTVYPILGNHEAHPADFYSPEDVNSTLAISSQWLLDLASLEWARWLPNDTQSTILKGGFYTVLVKPGFRIVALNSNTAFASNLWLVYKNTDYYDQLKWLVDVLAEAEKNGEKVHILSHIPPSDDYSSLVKIWSREFKKIVLRFSDTITAIFNGHTHYDEFRLFFNSSTSEEVQAVAYNGASFATFIGSNPNYRIYEVDNNNMMVTDFRQYIFNLTQANFNGKTEPEWYELYSFKEAYALPDLSLKSLGELFKKMAYNGSDNLLVGQYFRYRYRDSDVSVGKGCDLECKQKLVCLTKAGETSESIKCSIDAINVH